MPRSTMLRIVLGAIAVIALLGLLRFKPWQRSDSDTIAAVNTSDNANRTRQELTVGFLPVT